VSSLIYLPQAGRTPGFTGQCKAGLTFRSRERKNENGLEKTTIFGNENLQKREKQGRIGNVNRRLLNIKAGLVDFTEGAPYNEPIESTEETK
jgi:hypothetical protein